MSRARLAALGARQRAGYPRGIFAAAPALHTTVVVGRLPATAETLWLRLWGRGKAQERALDEPNGLPGDHPLRTITTQRMLRWRKEAEAMPRLSQADRELMKNTDRPVAKWEQGLLRKGRAEGEARGEARAVLAVLEARGLAVSEAQRARGLGRAGVKRPERWARKAVTAKTTSALFAARKRAVKVRR